MIVLKLLRAAGKGGWMPKVSTEHVQRRIAELDAQYTVAQPKRPGGFTALRSALALIILAITAVAAFVSFNRTSSDFVQLTLKQGPPAPAMLGAASTGLKRGE
jgi:hypothetical protein